MDVESPTAREPEPVPVPVPFATQKLVRQYIAHLEKWLTYGNHMLSKYSATFSEPDPFWGSKLHDAPLPDFVKYITRFGNIDDDCLLHSMYYIGQLIHFRSNPELITAQGTRRANFLHDFNVHRLVACSLMLASKYQLDFTWKFSGFAEIFGLQKEELQRLESNFVEEIHWELYFPEMLVEQQRALLTGYGTV
jgi:hypothetical protein